MKLNIAKDYSLFTGLRYCNISEFSGEDFYHKMLNKAFKKALDNNEKLTIIFDDVQDDGYSPSFIDEAFGNLVYDFSASKVKEHINFISTKDPHIENQIINMTIPKWEKRRLEQEAPKKTKKHESWYRLTDNGQIEENIWIKCH